MSKRFNYFRHLQCVWPSCQRRQSPTKYKMRHIRADSFFRGFHKNCRFDFCRCDKCKGLEPSGILMKHVQYQGYATQQTVRLRRTNDDFTTKGPIVKATVTIDPMKDFDENDSIVFNHIDQYGQTQQKIFNMKGQSPDHPLIREARLAHVQVKQQLVSILQDPPYLL